VEVLANVADRTRLESALVGWRTCGRPHSLQWLRLRALRLADRLEDRPGEETRVANLKHLAPARARPPSPASEMPILAGRSFDSRELAWQAVS
jgi:hypothetical protein